MVKITVSFQDEKEKKDILQTLKNKVKKVSKTYKSANGFNKVYIELAI